MTRTTQKQIEEERELRRIADEEMDDLHCHNAKGCYGQGEYL